MNTLPRLTAIEIAYLTKNQPNVNTDGIILNRIEPIAIICDASLFNRNDLLI